MADSENWFRKRRAELEMSQTDVVIAFLPARITTGAISGWERGQVPNLDLADDIARVYRTPVRKVLDVMHEMARARTAEAATAGK